MTVFWQFYFKTQPCELKKNTERVLCFANLLEQNFLFLEFHDQQSWPHLTLHIQIFSKLSKGSAGGKYKLIYHRKHPCGTRNQLSICNTAQWIKDESQPNPYPFWQLDYLALSFSHFMHKVKPPASQNKPPRNTRNTNNQHVQST